MRYFIAMSLSTLAVNGALADVNYAKFRIVAPVGAEVRIGNYRATTAASEHMVKTGALTSGARYSYTVTAQVSSNGQAYTQSQKVVVQAGIEYTVRFNFANSASGVGSGGMSGSAGGLAGGSMSGSAGGFAGGSRTYTSGGGGSTGSGHYAIKVNKDGSRTYVPVGGASGMARAGGMGRGRR